MTRGAHPPYQFIEGDRRKEGLPFGFWFTFAHPANGCLSALDSSSKPYSFETRIYGTDENLARQTAIRLHGTCESCQTPFEEIKVEKILS